MTSARLESSPENTILSLGLLQSTLDPCAFYSAATATFVVLVSIYMDDIVILRRLRIERIDLLAKTLDR